MSDQAGILGQVLSNRYTIQHRLGKKAGRQTWLAQDLQTQEPVVIKLLTFGKDFGWDDLKLFEREAETLKSLSHPAIPRYLDYLELHLPDCNGLSGAENSGQSHYENLATLENSIRQSNISRLRRDAHPGSGLVLGNATSLGRDNRS